MRIFYFLWAVFPLFFLDGVNKEFANKSVIKITDAVDDWFLFAEMNKVDVLNHFKNCQKANESIRKIINKSKSENNRIN